jgi:glycosyltransferase involved in cell wall biosynthesis
MEKKLSNVNEEIYLSIIIPVFNENETIKTCYHEINKKLEIYKNSIEIIFIDDGSSDNSVQILKELSQQDNRIKCIFLSRNFGKEAAMSAGINYTNGNYVVQIDCDLQDPPEIIPSMIETLEKNNCDVVYGVRLERAGESFVKRSTSYLFYKLIDKMSHIDIPRNTGDFRVMKKQVILALRELPETQRFMKGLFSWIGFKQIGFYYKRNKRIAGKTKFNYFKLWNFALEGITSFTNIPLKVATYVGFSISFLAFLISIFYLAKFFIIGDKIQGFLTLIVAILFMGGIQLMFLGILGEYLGRTYLETKRRPLYVIKEKINL